MEEIRVLGLATSPREKGNTAILLDAALEGARNEGARVERIDAAQIKINPCLACNACFKEGKCVQNDDMQKLYPFLESYEYIIIAAPIFSMGLCAQAKALIDRLQCFWARKYILKKRSTGRDTEKSRGLWISTAGSELERVFDGARPTISYFFAMLEIKKHESLTFRGVDEAGAILSVPGALEAARVLGARQTREIIGAE